MNRDAPGKSGVVISFGKASAQPLLPPSANDNGAAEANTVTIRRKLLKSGVTVKIKVPVSEFTGVAVSTMIDEEGTLVSAIDLIHPDPNLSYRVFEEEGNNTVVAEWQNWGRQLRLPLFIRSGSGELIAYSQQVGGVLHGESNVRRKLAPEANRRARFLNKRNIGIVVSN
jgi:hypothetical protein